MTLDAKPKRLFIYTKDVTRITGKGKSAAQSLIKSIKLKLNKDETANLTVIEFCQDQGLKIEEVNLYL